MSRKARGKRARMTSRWLVAMLGWLRGGGTGRKPGARPRGPRDLAPARRLTAAEREALREVERLAEERPSAP